MLKAVIIDDEPKIRRGLKKFIDNMDIGIEVVGEAEDGLSALEISKSLQPDILLVDICMPFLDGLQFIDELNKCNMECIIIVITGHDEFEYAQRALKLKVFDFLVKPVPKQHLMAVLESAKNELLKNRAKKKYLDLANKQLNKNFPLILENFLNSWVSGQLTQPEIEEQLKFFNLSIHDYSGMMVIRGIENLNSGAIVENWEKDLLVFAIQNIVTELLQDWKPCIVFKDDKGNIVAIIHIIDEVKWTQIEEEIENTIDKYIKKAVAVSQCKIKSITDIPKIYENLLEDVKRKSSYTPIVSLAQKYIETNYYNESLSLRDVAEYVGISPTYLSRLLKQEVGISFIDFLTNVRIKKALQLMEDQNLKIYEIAEKVGYSTQHYFSTAFKKVVGVSPAEYRKGGNK